MLKLSPTAIRTYLQCPAKYFFRFVQAIRKPIARDALFGLAIDHALGCHYTGVLETGQEPPLDLVEGVLECHAVALAESESEVPIKEVRQDIDIGVKAIRRYREHISPLTEPVAVQHAVRYHIDNVRMEGFIDLVEARGATDWKTSSRKFALRTTDLLQLLFYQVGLGLEFPQSARVSIHAIVRSKDPQVYVLEKIVDPQDVQLFFSTIKEVARGIAAASFPPNRDHPLCKRRYCQYWKECEEQYGGRVPE